MLYCWVKCKTKELSENYKPIQMATLWNFGISYHTRSDGKPYPMKMRYYYDFLLRKFFDTQPNYEPKSSNVIRVQPEQPTLVNFWKEVEEANKQVE